MNKNEFKSIFFIHILRLQTAYNSIMYILDIITVFNFLEYKNQ